MRHVVERPAHAGHKSRNPVEHPVEEPAELVERIVRALHGHACVEPAGLQDGLHDAGQLTKRPHRRAGEQGAAHHADEDDGGHGHDEDGAVPGEQLAADLVTLADLQ